jgi:uncharacterized protein YjbI with pentapeptide repeats
MSDVLPLSAIVRPRVLVQRDGGSLLLEDLIAEIADERFTGLIWLVGGPGSGKSTAIHYLTSLFATNEQLIFFDEPTIEEVRDARSDQLVVAATLSPAGVGGIVLRLAPWGFDDLVEYLQLAGRADCNSILSRIASAGSTTWMPELARIVIERFAADPSLADPAAAIVAEVRSHLTDTHQFAAAAQYCLALYTGTGSNMAAAKAVLNKFHCSDYIAKLLRHTYAQMPLASVRLHDLIRMRIAQRYLAKVLPRNLVTETARRCRDDEQAMQSLRGLLTARLTHPYHSMAASILRHADPTWRPLAPRTGIYTWMTNFLRSANPTEAPTPLQGKSYYFNHAYFDRVDWSNGSLTKSSLCEADFTEANLENCDLSNVNASSAVFAGATLRTARVTRICASRTVFDRADLQSADLSFSELAHASFIHANLTEVNLSEADLGGADLSNTNCTRANFSRATLSEARLEDTDFTGAKMESAILAHADLRTSKLDGVSFHGADLSHAQMEDVVIRGASWRDSQLDYAHLTGSQLSSADLQRSSLAFAHLADVDWRGANLSNADLRGASFHMGSSRSGLVGSPIACEGSKTGFYTDEREEMHFKRPEEIRKADLRGADLRGANIEGVDFYLVDLRGAKLDANQLAQARQTGAILDDWDRR